jgi:NAD(P)-dependent dehydrogenase (short-subunit alcohol dehydrogenase family)/SAM-dependent methyltransferase
VRHLPPDRVLRVLEIGAGTGGTTSKVLPVLPAKRCHYVYSDVSGGFFASAEQRFAQYPFVRYQVLDIERPPKEQGYAAHSFDLILAANVLHATRDIEATVDHVRQLLTPGGLLVLLEGLSRRPWLDLTFGLLEGWWRFDDALRRDYPLLTFPQWASLLHKSGFVGPPAAISTPDTTEQAVMISRGPQASTGGEERKGSWLIVSDERGLGQQLVKRFEQQNQACVLVQQGSVYRQLTDNVYELPLAESSAWDRFFVEILSAREPLRGIVHSILNASAPTSHDVLAESFSSCGSALALVQSLVRRETRTAAGLWLVTSGGQVVLDGDRYCPAQSGVWGLGKVLAQEHPELDCRRVDVDDWVATHKSLDGLIHELLHPDEEAEVAFRDGKRLVSRLVRSPVGRSSTPRCQRLSSGETYWITGGLGGLGLAVAKWLVENGAKHLVLTSRHAPAADVQRCLERLRDAGASVHVCLGDVSQESAVRGILAEIAANLPPLGGVIHAAGTLRDAVVRNQEWDSFEEVLRPKLLGAWHLHRLTQSASLRLFVLFSSTSAVFGSRGQANHAAANMFLDQLARHRRGLGLPAVSINWGAWSEVGAAAKRGTRLSASLDDVGLRWIEPGQGLRALSRVLAANPVQVAVAPVDWSLVKKQYAGLSFPPLLDEMFEAAESVNAECDQAALVLRLASGGNGKFRGALVEYLGREVQRVLRLATPPSVDASFFELGMDSLMGVELRNRLQRQLGASLKTSLAFDQPTIDSLADHLSQQLSGRSELVNRGQQRAATPIPRAPRTEPLVLSFAQQRLWFHQQLDPANPFYNEPVAIQLRGELDIDAMIRTLNEIVRRHDVLRTSFAVEGDQPVQRVAPAAEVKLRLEDLRHLPADRREPAARSMALAEVDRPFDLAHRPLLRTILFHLDDADYILLLNLHHIVCDGWSIGVLFVREFTQLYRAYSTGQKPPLDELPIQYADFARWQRTGWENEDRTELLAYWKQQLVDLPTLNLPTDRARPERPTFRGETYAFTIPQPMVGELRDLANQENCTLFETFLAAFQTLLSRYAHQYDIPVGCTVANRTRAELEGLIGFFVNQLVLRTDLSGAPKFQELMARVREVSRSAFAHQDMPFEVLVEELRPERRLNVQPLFQVLFVFDSFPTPPEESCGSVRMRPWRVDLKRTSKFDLTLFVIPGPGDWEAKLEYSTDLFHAATIRTMADNLLDLLQTVLSAPDVRLTELPLFHSSAGRAHRTACGSASAAGDSGDDGELEELIL